MEHVPPPSICGVAAPRLGQWRPALARRAPHPWRGQRRSSTADSPGGRSPQFFGFFGGFTTSCHHGIKWIYWIYIYIHLWTGISHAYIYICIYHLSAIEKRDNLLNGDLRSRFINHLRFVGWSSKASEQCQVPSVSDNSTRCKTQGRRGVADTADITHTFRAVPKSVMIKEFLVTSQFGTSLECQYHWIFISLAYLGCQRSLWDSKLSVPTAQLPNCPGPSLVDDMNLLSGLATHQQALELDARNIKASVFSWNFIQWPFPFNISPKYGLIWY